MVGENDEICELWSDIRVLDMCRSQVLTGTRPVHSVAVVFHPEQSDSLFHDVHAIAQAFVGLEVPADSPENLMGCPAPEGQNAHLEADATEILGVAALSGSSAVLWMPLWFARPPSKLPAKLEKPELAALHHGRHNAGGRTRHQGGPEPPAQTESAKQPRGDALTAAFRGG